MMFPSYRVPNNQENKSHKYDTQNNHTFAMLKSEKRDKN